MKVGIIGHGVVGKTMERALQGNEIRVYDKFGRQDGDMNDVIGKSEVIFICLPTPTAFETGVDTSIIDAMFDDVTVWQGKTFVIKSTVPPGYTDSIKAKYCPPGIVTFNPEFLTEASPLDDLLASDFIILGEDATAAEQVYRDAGFTCPIFYMKNREAEMVKYMSNVLGAMKIGLANELYDICQASDIDYDAVRNVVGLERRYSPGHLRVSQERGFGGKCLPKDLLGLIRFSESKGFEPTLLLALWAQNQRVRTIDVMDELNIGVL